jgi:hypothetical protein
MPPKSVTPSIRETAFDCPHCGTYTTQTWYDLYAKSRSGESRTPSIVDEEFARSIRANKDIPAETKARFLPLIEKQLTGLVCLDPEQRDSFTFTVFDLHLSQCFNCKDFSVWVHDKLVFPESRHGPPPNPDMPDNVKVDYEEASKILNLSPRGAAALLRLAIQKICADLGETGENINNDIASLVKKDCPKVFKRRWTPYV